VGGVACCPPTLIQAQPATSSSRQAAGSCRGRWLAAPPRIIMVMALQQQLLLVLTHNAVAAAATGLRAQWFGNAVLAPKSCPGEVAGAALHFSSDADLPSASQCAAAGATPPTLGLFSARFDGTITAPHAGSWEFRVVTNGAVRMWIDDHILVDSSCDQHMPPPAGAGAASPFSSSTSTSTDRDGGFGHVECKEWDVPAHHSTVTFAGRDNVTHHIERGLHLRLEWLHYGGGGASLQILWRPGTPSSLSPHDTAAGAFALVPSSALAPTISAAEQWRQGVQAELSTGWNTWMRENAMRHVHLPSGFGVEVQLWEVPPPPPPSPPAPPALRPEQWTTLSGTDFRHNAPGGNKCMVKAPNVTACAQHCAAMPGCVAASWNGRSDHCCNFKCDAAGRFNSSAQDAIIVRPGSGLCGTGGGGSSGPARRIDLKGLVDKCRGSDASTCKVVPGHHSFNGAPGVSICDPLWLRFTYVTSVLVTNY
jgi:hypothetical protein